MAKKKAKPLKPGEIVIEACYVGEEFRDRQKIGGKRNKNAWPKGKGPNWRKNPELIPDEYWYEPMGSSGEESAREEKVSRKVFREVAAIREEALAKGWLEPWLFTRRFWNRHPATPENLPGLVVLLDDDDEITEVTEEYIAIKKPGGHISRFFVPREAEKLREYERRKRAGESVDDLVGKRCDKPPAKPPEKQAPRKKVVTAPKAPKISIADAFKKPEERGELENRRARKKVEAEKPAAKDKSVSADEDQGIEDGCLF